MRPLHTELLLFHPCRNVVFGMPIFVGHDGGRLHRLLRGHGQHPDNSSVWYAGLVGDPARLVLGVTFDDARESAYLCCLLESSDPEWQQHSTRGNVGFAKESWHVQPGASLELARVWLVTRDAEPRAITAAQPGALGTQRGYWFPCDGAVAFDVSAVSSDSVPKAVADLLSTLASFDPHVADGSESAWVERLMAQPALIAALRERAECCFAFRVLGNVPGILPDGLGAADLVWIRSSPLRNRRGRLLEADLTFRAMGNVFAGVTR